MSGSSGSSNSNSNANSTYVAPTTSYNTTGYNNLGYQPTPQTYTAQGKPSWMTGAWNMPQWGTSAATGQQLTQADLQPRPTSNVMTNNQPVAQQQSLGNSYTEPTVSSAPLGSDGTQWYGNTSYPNQQSGNSISPSDAWLGSMGPAATTRGQYGGPGTPGTPGTPNLNSVTPFGTTTFRGQYGGPGTPNLNSVTPFGTTTFRGQYGGPSNLADLMNPNRA